jgi:hypothetical protein
MNCGVVTIRAYLLNADVRVWEVWPLARALMIAPRIFNDALLSRNVIKMPAKVLTVNIGATRLISSPPGVLRAVTQAVVTLNRWPSVLSFLPALESMVVSVVSLVRTISVVHRLALTFLLRLHTQVACGLSLVEARAPVRVQMWVFLFKLAHHHHCLFNKPSLPFVFLLLEPLPFYLSKSFSLWVTFELTFGIYFPPPELLEGSEFLLPSQLGFSQIKFSLSLCMFELLNSTIVLQLLLNLLVSLYLALFGL